MDELVLTTSMGAGGRISGMLAFVICLIGHQSLLFAIGRWSVELDGWRALFTTTAGIAGLSIGSVTLPSWAAPLGALLAALLVMRYVYEMDCWQQSVMAVGWYAFPLGSLLLAGFLFGMPAGNSSGPPPRSKNEILESIKRPMDRTRPQAVEEPPSP